MGPRLKARTLLGWPLRSNGKGHRLKALSKEDFPTCILAT